MGRRTNKQTDEETGREGKEAGFYATTYCKNNKQASLGKGQIWQYCSGSPSITPDQQLKTKKLAVTLKLTSTNCQNIGQ